MTVSLPTGSIRRGLLALVVPSVVAMAACSAAPVGTAAPPAPEQAAPAGLPVDRTSHDPVGEVRVAYPDVPARWVDPDGGDVAALDLAAIWGLPLFRIDDAGQLRSGLVTGFDEHMDGDRFLVWLDLAEGDWSDGTPVNAEDVVATFGALREAGAPTLELLVDADTVDGRVRLTFSQRTDAWPYALIGSGGVLPARVLADGGLATFASDLPVTGGWFRLDTHEPGRSATFVANEGSPLGAPGLQRVTILFVPRYEAALGFLDSGDADLVLGHLALNPVERALALDGVTAAAPIGGTSVVLEARSEGRLGDESPQVRREVLSAIEVGQLVEGLLADAGAPATSMFPGVDGPFVEERLGVSSAPAVVMLTPRWHEIIGFTARTVERDLESHQIVTDLVSEETPFFTRTARSRYDLVLRIRRDPPLPALSGYAAEPDRSSVAAVAMGERRSVDDRLAEAAFVRPLYRAGPAHAWDRSLEGIRPSSWPGLAFWNVGSWTRSAP